MKLILIIGSITAFTAMAVWVSYAREHKTDRAMLGWWLSLFPAIVFIAVLIYWFPNIPKTDSILLKALFIPALFGVAAFAGGGLIMLIHAVNEDTGDESIDRIEEQEDFDDSPPGGPVVNGGEHVYGSRYINGGQYVHGGPYNVKTAYDDD